MSNNSADTNIRREGGGGHGPGTRADISLLNVVKSMMRKVCPCSTWRSAVEQRSTLWLLEDHPLEQVP